MVLSGITTYLVLNGMLNGIWDFMVFSGTENTI